MRRPRTSLLIALLAVAAAPAGAQTIVTSAGPANVGVTIYQAPHRRPGVAIDLDWLEGYALISETRQVSLPAGESDIRFEGVAGGIVPQSAIVTGLPDGIVERNRDAYLLSAVSLLDRSLGRRVHLRRTSGATGAVTEQDAILRSGSGGALVVQTRDGFEALRCTGLAETPIYEEVPAGLSARPTLSVRTRASRPVTATITLSYLATGFDWQANYIGNLSPDGTSLDLFAWLTLASMDETSFRDAETQAVAGRINGGTREPEEHESERLELRCWPQQSTSDIPLNLAQSQNIHRNSDTVVDAIVAQDLGRLPDRSVTEVLQRMVARQEDLGDLKLYRIPEPVTVASNSQKQVAFLQRDHVRVAMVYRQLVSPSAIHDNRAAALILVTRNRPEEGLGIPLPGGRIQLFAAGGGRPLLLGEGSVGDHAVGEEVEIAIGEAPGVNSRLVTPAKHGDYVLTVTNDRAAPVRYEAEFALEPDHDFRPRVQLPRRNGRPLWAVVIPANGSATLSYLYRDRRR